MGIDGRLRFEILGEVRALRGGVPVDLGPAKQRAVLAVLLLQAGRPVPIHQIVDAVWGDDPPENGANVVQKYVAGLRRALDPERAPRTPGELLALTGSGYVLRTAEAAVDFDEFQAAVNRATAERAANRPVEAAATLRAGLALWHADALAGLGGSVFDAARARLADAHASAWEMLAEIGLSQGRADSLIPELTRLVAEFPLREGLRAQLMLALQQTGRQAEALAVFRDAREYFLDEFGAEPGERMQEAHRRILRAEPVPADPPPKPSPPPIPYWRPTRRRASVPEIVFAAIAPLVTCALGSWTFFLYVAVRRREPPQFIVAAVYFVLILTGTIIFLIDPSPIDADPTFGESLGITLMIPLTLGAAVHGVVVALRPGDYERQATLRDQARQFAAFDPARAIELGVGRPDVPGRPFDDGGLIDLNHLGAYELSQAVGLPVAHAQRIVGDRLARGPFRSPGDLVTRGLADERIVRRNAYRLICIPSAQQRLPGAGGG